jgi:DNA-binding transcriptional LysR family regulator
MLWLEAGNPEPLEGLQRDLGAALFERDRHRVALTDAGKALLPEARATLAAAQAARDVVGAARGGLRGTVTVGTMQSTGALDLPGRLGRFHATHPAVQVRLRQAAAGSAGLAREVLSGALDLAVLSLPGPPPAGLTAWPVTEEPLVVVCQPGHPLASRHPVTLGRLAEEPFIDFPPGWGNRAVVDRAFAAAGRERQVPVRGRRLRRRSGPGAQRPRDRIPAGLGRGADERPGRRRAQRARADLAGLGRGPGAPPHACRGAGVPRRTAP